MRFTAHLVACTALVLQAQAPVITGFHPDTMIVHPDLVYVSTQLTGDNFWRSGPNDPSRRHIYIRTSGGAWTESGIGIQGILNNELDISILSQPYLASAGLIEIKVAIDGVESNVFPIHVRKELPRLDSALPDQILLTASMDERAFKIGLRGRFWVSPIVAVINGKEFGTLYQHTDYGDEVFSWPEALRKPGVYVLALKDALGTSEARTVEIVGPPLLTATTPAAIHPSDLAPKAAPESAPTTRSTATHAVAPASLALAPARLALATFELRATFQGSAPTKVSWRTDQAPWQDVSVHGIVKGSEVRLPLPVNALSQAAWVEIHASNKAGESQIRVPMAPDTKDYSRSHVGPVTSPFQPPPKETRFIPRDLPPMPPPVTQRLAALAPRLQPSARAWVEDQASRQRTLPAPDVDAVRAAARARFAPSAAPVPAAASLPGARPGTRPVGPAPTATFSRPSAVIAGPSDTDALAFLVLAQAAKEAQEDLTALMDGMKRTQKQKDGLRELLNQIDQEQPGSHPASAPCTSPLCGTIAGRARDLAGQLPGRARPAIQPVATYGDLVRLGSTLKTSLGSLDEMGEAESLRLQQGADRLSKFMAALSNLEKKLNDTSQAVVANLK